MSTQDNREIMCDSLKEQLTAAIDLIETKINATLKNDGDTCEFSQRICLLEKLGYFQHTVNGISPDDLL